MADHSSSFTLVGHRSPVNPGSTTPAVILLNRGSRLVRRDYLAELVNCGFSEIISVEAQEHSYSVEALAGEFETVRFLLLNHMGNIGRQINLALPLVAADHVLIMWSSMEPPASVERMQGLLNDDSLVCIAPALRGNHGEPLPVVQVPTMQRRLLRVVPLPLRGPHAATLFPFDFTGLYHRQRTIDCRGFDEGINHPFWQKMDFGFRLAMWNLQIIAHPVLRMSYRSMPDPEDQTPTPGYARFYARNLAVRLRETGPAVKALQGVPFALRAGLGIGETVRTFRDASQWVEEHQERYRRDARQVIHQWKATHE